MLLSGVPQPQRITDFTYARLRFDLASGQVLAYERVPVRDAADFLGGIGRSFRIMAEHRVRDPFAPDSPLVVNVGCLTGTAYMTGLRAFFTAYSPLKRTRAELPMAAWSAMSGCFGRKFAAVGVDDLILTGRVPQPGILVLRQGDPTPSIEVQPAPAELIGARTPAKVAWLNQHFNDPARRRILAHFAVIGPAGEHWQDVWYACIAGTTQEQLLHGEDKFRFAGRLGMGSVLGSKNILAIVAHAERDRLRPGDERLEEVNRQIGAGEQSKGYRHPDNHGGGGGTGRLERVLDSFGVLPYRNFEPRGEQVARSSHLESVRESAEFVVVDRGCFGCRIACHQDVHAAPPEGKDPDPRRARRRHGPYLGRYEFEPMELHGPNLGVADVRANLRQARLCDELGLDAISAGVVLAFAMENNERGRPALGGGIRFGDAAGAARLLERIAAGQEPLLGKGVRVLAREAGGSEFAMHAKGVEHSAYLPQTNPGYPFATAGGHMSMRTFLLYVTDPHCQPDSADYWVRQIVDEGWKMINVNLHGGCLFAMAPPAQVAAAIEALYGVQLSAEQILAATYDTHLLGFALEQRQGITAAEYDLCREVFAGERKGDLPGVHFLTRELFEQIRARVLQRFGADARARGYVA